MKTYFVNLTIRSSKPGVFQSQTMSAVEFGGTGCTYLKVEFNEHYVRVTAIQEHKESQRVQELKTSVFNRDCIAEVYGDHYRAPVMGDNNER